MDKQSIKTLNSVYRTSRLRLLRYPLSESSDLSRDQGMIDKLIRSGHLAVRQKPITPSLSVDILAVSELGECHVSANTKWYVAQARHKAKVLAKRNKRMLDVDFYKHERNPFLGGKLRRHGGKTICTECYAVNKPCGHGEAFLRALPVDARPPRANASKTRWKAFAERFLNR